MTANGCDMLLRSTGLPLFGSTNCPGDEDAAHGTTSTATRMWSKKVRPVPRVSLGHERIGTFFPSVIMITTTRQNTVGTPNIP